MPVWVHKGTDNGEVGLDTSKLDNSAAVASFVGFIAGVASSDLVKLLIAKAKRGLRM